MAGSVVQGDKSGNILVEFDYNNIIVVDPNKTIDAFGNIKERLVDHENMVMYANLEADLLPRTKLALGSTPANENQRTIPIASMNFLRPTEGKSLTTGYYDELTGKGAREGLADNQLKKEIGTKGDKPYEKVTIASPDGQPIDNGLLGIKSIQVRTSTSFTPSVSMVLEDVQGRALFQLGDNSPYAAFFNLPYPPFYLTLKGYYGQAIRYQLNLKTFNASFNSFSGNYTVKLEFVGFKFNILNEISVGSLLAAPHMYSNRFNISQSPTSPEPADKNIRASASQTNAISKESTISPDNVVTELVTEKGYQKIVEVYSEYKAKGLLPENFPELTLAQLINKLEKFEQNIVNSYKKVNVESLTNIRTYKEVLNAYFTEVRETWFNLYLNPKPIVTTYGEYLYTFKDSYSDVTSQTGAIEQLKKYIIEFNNLLAVNKTLGARGTTPIKNPITYDMFVTPFVAANIDWGKTTVERTGIKKPTALDISTQVINLQKTQKVYGDGVKITNGVVSNVDVTYPPVFIFDGKNRFKNTINQMNTEASQKLSAQETKLSAELARKIEDKATGIGFKPSVRNMCAVIMANAEGFIRLLDDVHTTAWNLKYDPVRKEAILNHLSSAPGTDTQGNVNISAKASNENQGINTGQIPVYPWPQYFEESTEDKKGRFQLKYIADPSVVDTTKGYLFAKWPEVEFVEEYMRGLTQKFNPPIVQPPLDTESTTKIININAIEYPSSGIAYANKEEIKFFYEIWERQFLTTHYSGFIRANQNQVGELIKLNNEVETNNLVSGIGISSPYISLKLKNYDLTSSNYQKFLESISNQGTGKSYQEYIRDFFVTPYIKTLTESSFNILSIFDLGKNPETSPISPGLKQLVANASNTPLIIDTYPFTNPTWVSENMSSAVNNANDSVYNTTKVLKVYEPRNVISNFTSINDTTTNRPVTNFSYLLRFNPTLEVKNLGGLFNFYDGRRIDNTNADSLLIATEGYVNYISPNNIVPTQTTTTILNTPYFINSIQNGVYNWRKKDKYPYVQAAYLFINSLPLANLREKYRTKGETSELDYIASCFKKFGAIHKMPYAWVLKLGSIWYRYKTYKQSNVDILDSAWTNFNYKANFDPITSATTKTYNFEFEDKKSITLQDDSKGDINIQTGFYPKVINDFNVFYTGYDLYTTYTDEEIQNSVNGGMKVFDFKDSNIVTTQDNKALTLTTWSVVLPDNVIGNNEINCNPTQNTKSYDYFVVPSFGNELNQTKLTCFKNENLIVPLTDNQSMYNGSVRLLWDAPNYGYFDNSQIVKPQPNSYMNKISTKTNYQAPFSLLNVDEYSKIDEIFSVFDKSILDQFEQEFLNFSKPIADIDLGPQVTVPLYASPVDPNAIYKNFQYLFRTLMSVPGMKTSQTTSEYFLTIGNAQITTFETKIQAFLEYDVILKYGNPANYKRRAFDSFISYKSSNSTVVDPINFDPYVPNTLPSSKGGITLAQSRIQYPLEWATLETEVGFSTIDNLIYTNFGSYITDFFIDNDIKFSVNNIVLCAPLIKMYATQKLYTPSITSSSFKTKIQDYLQTATSLQNTFLNDLLNSVRITLPNQQQLPEKTIQSVIDGQQSKVENYEVFKALNDKWIAGSDFKNKTLFEDFLFLDRASRNIGDTIILDIFDLKRMLSTNALNMEMSVFTLLSGMLIQNKFNVMPLPAYVNFYNVQDVDGTTISQNTEGSLQFADNMWGTFLDVDYRKSSPKILCFYTGLPSAYLDLPKNNSKFRSDGFEMRRASENPLIENQQNKKDWAVSNRCVGFNVDMGIRNQNVFNSFSVSMDSGKATSESIQTQLNMINQESGRTVATQNISLYDLYKNRSYKCDVGCLGNALLQPMMYFNLRNVPMFYGPYMILDVTHSINPGSFITNFTGIRQGIYDLPAIDNYLQSINQNLLTKIEALLLIKKDDVTAKAITDIGKAAQVVQSANNTKAAPNSCVNNLKIPYLTWAKVEPATSTSLNAKEFGDALKAEIPNNPTLQILIFLISYVGTYRKSNKKFEGYNNNYGLIDLTYNWAENSGSFIAGQTSCVNIKNSISKTESSQPIANFASLGEYIRFMSARLTASIPRITDGANGIGITKYYVCYWPNNNGLESTYDSRLSEFTELDNTFLEAFKLAGGDAGLNVEATNVVKNADKDAKQKIKDTFAGKATIPNNLNVTVVTDPTCLPPVIKTFTPTTGRNDTIVRINGEFLGTTSQVMFGTETVQPKYIEIIDDSNINFVVPKINTEISKNVNITVQTKNGNVTSTSNFIYNPQQTLPSPSTDVNTNPSPVTLVSSVPSTGGLKVVVANNVGDWIINPYPKYIYKITKDSVGSNNTVQTITEMGNDSLTVINSPSYVINNQFNITDSQFLLNVLGLSVEKINSLKGSNVNVLFYVKAVPFDRVKYKQDVELSFKMEFAIA